MAKEKTFLLHWLDSSTQTIKGLTISEAFTKAGYGAGAINALDYFDEVTSETMEDENCKNNVNHICQLGSNLPCLGQICVVKTAL